jgi:hypothetical protein
VSARPDYKNHFSKTFCLVLGWLEVTQQNTSEDDAVWIWEADDVNGRLVLLGPQDKCNAFQQVCEELVLSTPDPDSLWRYY